MSASWPEQDLEHLGHCPACGGEARRLRFSGLVDKAFRAAEGEWSMYDCDGCGAAYLDPRPDPQSIGRAYSRYYTHVTAEDEAPDAGMFWRSPRLKHRLKTGYINRRHGYRFPLGLGIGAAVLRWKPEAREQADFHIRHLPPPPRPGARLLDVGCGNGDFLKVAEALGYAATGIDPDPKAVAAARRHGLDVRPGLLPDPAFVESGFSHITLSHVLEHLHAPRGALEQALALLEPGGRIWLSQPNLDASGLRRFGADWRGLETPRHLTLFSFESLRRLLADIGYTDIRLVDADAHIAGFYYRQSLAMGMDLDPYENWSPPGWGAVQNEVHAATRAARADPLTCESLTVTARRPG